MTTNVLVGVCLYRPLTLWYEALLKQKYSLGKLDILLAKDGYANADDAGKVNILDKLNAIRSTFLAGDYDYLVLNETDNVMRTNNTIERLVQAMLDDSKIDVLYSPYVLRCAGQLSSAILALDTGK